MRWWLEQLVLAPKFCTRTHALMCCSLHYLYVHIHSYSLFSWCYWFCVYWSFWNYDLKKNIKALKSVWLYATRKNIKKIIPKRERWDIIDISDIQWIVIAIVISFVSTSVLFDFDQISVWSSIEECFQCFFSVFYFIFVPTWLLKIILIYEASV